MMPFAARSDVPLMQIDDALSDREPEALAGDCAAVSAVLTPETVKHVLAVFGRNAFTCVEYRQDAFVAARFQLKADDAVII